ncbi:phage holin family protein, partial [Lacticaseibacillus parakribbianus]|uniref:phage holin family protein n=1 Tax=Lacticaseibacillus parakribbianus TaxID=2970927 RepID=UPI0021CB74A7
FFDLLWRAFSNPYVVAMMLGSAWSAINDPTTAGVSDSMQALTYTEPKSDRGSAGPIGPAGQPGADGDAANEEDTNDSED